MRVVAAALVALISVMLVDVGIAQDRPVILVDHLDFLPPLQDNVGVDGFDVKKVDSAESDCITFMQMVHAQDRLEAVISNRCSEMAGQLAGQYPDVLFITGGEKVNGLPDNVLQLTVPAAFTGLSSAARTEFETWVPLSICGSSWQPTGSGLFACLTPAPALAGVDTFEQLHFQAALDVLAVLNSKGALSNPASAREALNGIAVDTALGNISFDSEGAASASLPIELTWRPEDKAQASMKFQNADSAEILQFLTDNLDPASAGVSKTCGTTCPSSCNNNCEKSGNEQCCKVASHDLPLN